MNCYAFDKELVLLKGFTKRINEAWFQEIMKVSKIHYERHYGYDIYKGSSSCQQFLKQEEIDVLGLKIDRGSVTYIYGVDIAFHEGGLNYGGVIGITVIYQYSKAGSNSLINKGKGIRLNFEYLFNIHLLIPNIL